MELRKAFLIELTLVISLALRWPLEGLKRR
jgi:hypothetical protein